VLASVLIAQDLPERALGLLDRLYAAAAQGRMGSIIEIQALLALALAAAGEEAGAVNTLAEALALGQPQGYIRVFGDEGAPLAALLGRLIATRAKDLRAAGVSLGYLSRLRAAIEPLSERADSRSRPAPIPGLIEALSERELEVLRLVAAGKANREIATELFVTLDTVKKHTTHTLAKLGASNRTEAVARARELNLVR
jgi:LuxR family maltose regulon positive regulatory protein